MTEPFGNNQQNHNPYHQTSSTLATPNRQPSSTGGTLPLGNTKNPNRMSNTTRLPTTSTSSSATTGLNKQTVVSLPSNSNNQRGMPSQQQQPQNPQNPSNSNNNNNNEDPQVIMPNDLRGPSCWTLTKRYFMTTVFWIQGWYRRLLTVPF